MRGFGRALETSLSLESSWVKVSVTAVQGLNPLIAAPRLTSARPYCPTVAMTFSGARFGCSTAPRGAFMGFADRLVSPINPWRRPSSRCRL